MERGYKSHSGQPAGEFLTIGQYKNANAWADRIAARPAVQRGMQVGTASSESSHGMFYQRKRGRVMPAAAAWHACSVQHGDCLRRAEEAAFGFSPQGPRSGPNWPDDMVRSCCYSNSRRNELTELWAALLPTLPCAPA